MTDATEPVYSDTRWSTLGLIAALAAFVVLAEVGIWSTFLEIDFLRHSMARGEIVESHLLANDRRQALVGGFQLLAFVLSAVLLVRWVYLTNRNAHALEGTGMNHGPAGAAASFLVPGLHVRKPFQVLSELFRVSNPDHIRDWQQAPVPHLLSLWWTLWILFQLTIALALGADLWASGVEQLHVAAWGSAVAGVVGAPLGVAASICAWRLHALQRERFRRTAPMRLRQPYPTRTAESGESVHS